MSNVIPNKCRSIFHADDVPIRIAGGGRTLPPDSSSEAA